MKDNKKNNTNLGPSYLALYKICTITGNNRVILRVGLEKRTGRAGGGLSCKLIEGSPSPSF